MPDTTDRPTRDRRAHLSDVPAFRLHQAVDAHLRQLGPSYRLRALDDGNGYAIEKRRQVPNAKGVKVATWVAEGTYASLADLARARGLEVKP